MTAIVKRTQFSNGEITVITALAGVMSSICSNPIWMMNTRLAIKKKEDSKAGVFDLIRQIIDKEGIGAFFKGVIPNLILVLNPIINFVVYEHLKRIALKSHKRESDISFGLIFLMSSVGKILATFATYPILTIRVRLQADEKRTEGGITYQASKIATQIKDLGLSGLYHGIEAKLLQTVLYNAFLMMTYEKLRTLIKIIVLRALYS